MRDRNLEDLFGRGTFWPNVDWTKTRAYALALGQIYVNLKGTRALWHRGARARSTTRCAPRSSRQFGALRDPDTGEAVVRQVYRREEIY